MGGKLVFYNARAEHNREKNIFQGCAGDPKNCIFDTPFFRKETQKRWKNYDWKRRKDSGPHPKVKKNEHGGR